jgi:hypothetical protein
MRNGCRFAAESVCIDVYVISRLATGLCMACLRIWRMGFSEMKYVHLNATFRAYLPFLHRRQSQAHLTFVLDNTSGKGQDKRREFFYWTDDGNLAGLRYEQWKAVFLEQKAEGFGVW